MRYATTARFDRNFLKFPASVRAAFRKQVSLLARNIRHPSLRAKKYDESQGVWQARVTHTVRFYFQIQGNIYLLLDIEKHKD
jgi:mRNA-degrading endonuclease RelE of RelBE toxin-antitoxin system